MPEASLACPACGVPFPKFPARKSKCKACKVEVFPKRGPDDPEKRLVLAEEAARMEAAWDARNEALYPKPDTSFEARSAQERERLQQLVDEKWPWVRISAGKDSCPACLAQRDEKWRPAEALARMPIPHRACTNRVHGFCRCRWVPWHPRWETEASDRAFVGLAPEHRRKG